LEIPFKFSVDRLLACALNEVKLGQFETLRVVSVGLNAHVIAVKSDLLAISIVDKLPFPVMLSCVKLFDPEILITLNKLLVLTSNLLSDARLETLRPTILVYSI